MEEFEVIYPVVTKQIYEGVLFDFKPIDNIASYHVRYSNFELQMFRPTGLDVWIFKAPQEFFDSLTMNEWRCWVAYLIGFSRSYHENFLFIESSDDDTKNYKLNSETKVLSIIYNTAIIAIDLIKDPDMYYEFYAKLLQNNLVPSLVVLYYFKTLPCYTGLYEHLLFLVTQFTANDKLQVNNEENNKTKGSLYPWWYSTKNKSLK